MKAATAASERPSALILDSKGAKLPGMVSCWLPLAPSAEDGGEACSSSLQLAYLQAERHREALEIQRQSSERVLEEIGEMLPPSPV